MYQNYTNHCSIDTEQALRQENGGVFFVKKWKMVFFVKKVDLSSMQGALCTVSVLSLIHI